MTYKERQEQSLLSALDDVYEAQEGRQPKAIVPGSQLERTDERTPQVSRPCVFIDGENTFFQIFDTLRYKRLVRYREDLVKFDLAWLGNEVLGSSSFDYLYYGTKLKEEDSTPELLERTRRMIDHKRRWIGFLSNLGVEFVTAGELRIRDTSSAGEETNLTFAEKGVDVRMAVDMIELAAKPEVKELVLMSSDADLAPVVPAVQRHGVKLTYLAFEGRVNDHIAGAANRTEIITNQHIVEAFKKAN